MLLCCWWCLRSEVVELDSRRVEHHCVVNCDANSSNAIAAVSLDQWENGTTSTLLQPSQRSAECCSWSYFKLPQSVSVCAKPVVESSNTLILIEIIHTCLN